MPKYEPKQRTQEINNLAEWDKTWPNACKKCNSWGMHVYRDSVDYGSTTATLESTEPCENCIEEGACPRCSEIILFIGDHAEQFVSEQQECPLCGWSWGKKQDDIRPEPDCYY